MFIDVLNHPELHKYDLSTLRKGEFWLLSICLTPDRNTRISFFRVRLCHSLNNSGTPSAEGVRAEHHW